MYGVVISTILLYPWALGALASIWNGTRRYTRPADPVDPPGLPCYHKSIEAYYGM